MSWRAPAWSGPDRPCAIPSAWNYVRCMRLRADAGGPAKRVPVWDALRRAVRTVPRPTRRSGQLPELDARVTLAVCLLPFRT